MDKMPITREGLEKLRQELHAIIAVDRPQNIKAIEEARAHGDLNENAEYHAAKERQSFLEAKRNELEMAISRSEVIEISNEPAENIIFGSTVELNNLASNQTVTYQLVGPYESNPEDGKISVTSPLGKALIGKEEDDYIKLKTPGGVQEFEILEIK
ncbi:MAG: transcription elongation factor GreA [Deltaproteobacteria bacterium]|nr:transcription elongation factor GreA [Deltaproteobacteria bacterium]